MGRYDALQEYLEDVESDSTECTLTFAEIERIIDGPLPASAREHRPWWGNEQRAGAARQCSAWLDAGWVVEAVDLQSGWVRFTQAAPSAPAVVAGSRDALEGSGGQPASGAASALATAGSTGSAGPASGRMVALVAGVGQKRSQPSPARDLYLSAFFVAARAFAERNADAWYVLSARHGLVAPDTVIGPYLFALKDTPRANRVAWASRVAAALPDILRPGDRVVFLASEDIREGLVDAAREIGCTVELPFERLSSNEQLRWLKEHAG